MSEVTFLDVLAPSTQSRAAREALVRTSSRRVLAGVAVGATVLASGCLPETKTTEGRALHGAPERLEKAPSVALALTVSSRLEERGTLASRPASDPGLSLTGLLDLEHDRATYSLDGMPVAVFDGDDAYAKRPNALPTDARPWVHVVVDEDLQDRVLDPVVLPSSLVAFAVRPSLLVDALGGALTGSIETRGQDSVDGTTTQHYAMRVDLAQALSKAERVTYSQRQQDDLAAFFEILGIEEDDLHDGEVWLDGDGVPRRIVLELNEEPSADTELVVRFDLTLSPQDAPAEVQVPKASTVATVPQLFQYLQPLKREEKA